MVGIIDAKLNDPAKKTHIFAVNKITNTINYMGLKLRGGSTLFSRFVRKTLCNSLGFILQFPIPKYPL